MCVNYKGHSWERPATIADCQKLKEYFPKANLVEFLATMSQDGGLPLTSDMALIGAMLGTEPDDLGMCFVPFSGINRRDRTVVKLPVMEDIVDWLENTALGTDMWMHASELAEQTNAGRFHFAMNCGCGLVAQSAKQSGNWRKWQQRFNQERADIYGRSRLEHRSTNDLSNLDITPSQLDMWQRIREALFSL